MDGDESLSLTPGSHDGMASQWQKSQQKSYLANKAANRTVSSDQNALNRLGKLTSNNQNINTMNIMTPSTITNKESYNTTQMFFANKHNRSLQRDAELE